MSAQFEFQPETSSETRGCGCGSSEIQPETFEFYESDLEEERGGMPRRPPGGARAAARPGARPGVRPGARPGARTAARPGVRPGARPTGARPAGARRPGGRPSGARPGVGPSRPGARGKPRGKRAGGVRPGVGPRDVGMKPQTGARPGPRGPMRPRPPFAGPGGPGALPPSAGLPPQPGVPPAAPPSTAGPGPTPSPHFPRPGGFYRPIFRSIWPFPIVTQPGAPAPPPETVAAGEPGTPEASSELIRWAQDCLNRILNLNLTASGKLDVQTRSAIRSFQRGAGIHPSGIVSPATEEALKDACGGSAAEPAAEPDANPEPDASGQGPESEYPW